MQLTPAKEKCPFCKITSWVWSWGENYCNATVHEMENDCLHALLHQVPCAVVWFTVRQSTRRYTQQHGMKVLHI